MAETTMVLRKSPFSHDPGVVPVRAGQTLLAMLQEAAGSADVSDNLRVEVGGLEIPRSHWATTRPKAGVHVHVTRMPAGGGDGKKWLRTILLVAVMVISYGAASGWFAAGGYFAAGSASALALSAAISVVGPLVVPALTPEASR